VGRYAYRHDARWFSLRLSLVGLTEKKKQVKTNIVE